MDFPESKGSFFIIIVTNYKLGITINLVDF